MVGSFKKLWWSPLSAEQSLSRRHLARTCQNLFRLGDSSLISSAFIPVAISALPFYLSAPNVLFCSDLHRRWVHGEQAGHCLSAVSKCAWNARGKAGQLPIVCILPLGFSTTLGMGLSPVALLGPSKPFILVGKGLGTGR